MRNRSLKKARPSLGLVAVMLAGVWLGFLPRAVASADANPCASNPANRTLDFWLGDWTIAAPGGSQNSTSRVTLELDKCLVIERWDGGRGHSGENLFAYSADDKSWHGLFADNEGRVHVFLNGKAAPGSAEFTGPNRAPDGETVLNRVTISRTDANHVEQLWQKSSDRGKTWTTVFRGEYTRIRP